MNPSWNNLYRVEQLLHFSCHFLKQFWKTFLVFPQDGSHIQWTLLQSAIQYTCRLLQIVQCVLTQLIHQSFSVKLLALPRSQNDLPNEQFESVKDIKAVRIENKRHLWKRTSKSDKNDGIVIIKIQGNIFRILVAMCLATNVICSLYFSITPSITFIRWGTLIFASMVALCTYDNNALLRE